MSPKKKEVIGFDEVLEQVGGWGPFQWKLLAFFILSTFLLSYVGYAPILYNYTPEHWCHVPQNLSSGFNLSNDVDAVLDLFIPFDDEKEARSQCLMYDPDFIDLNVNQSSWPTVKCLYGMEYNYTGYFISTSSQFDWVCDDSWKPSFSQSMFFAGAICGTLIFGWISDHFGRFWTLMLSNINIMIFGIATPFANNFITFTALRFMTGMSFPTHYMCIYMLSLEYVSIKKRAMVGNLSLAIGLPVGGCIQAWILKAVGDWTTFHHILFCQTLLILLAPWFLKESSRWLMTKGRAEEAVEILTKIGEENGKDLKPEFVDSIRKMAEEESKSDSKKLTFLDLFKTPILRKNVILMIINWSFTSLLFEANVRNIENLPFSIYWTYTIYSFLELPSDLAAIIGLNLIGRRWSAVLSLTGFFLTCIVSIIWFEVSVIVTVFGMIGRLFIIYGMNTACQLTFEVVPTQLRGQGNALANVCAQISNFFGPQIVFSKVIDERMPNILMAVLGILAALVAIFLPETNNIKLPDSIEEAEISFKRNNLFELKKSAKVEPAKSIAEE